MTSESNLKQQTNYGQSSDIGRRNFIQSSSLALLAATLINPDIASASALSATLQARVQQPGRAYFRSDTYSSDDIESLYGRGAGGASSKRAGFGNEVKAGDQISSQHMIFYYDKPGDKQIVNPLNVKPSLAAGKYSLEVTILNSHASQRDFDNLWKKFKHDAQMQLALTAPSNDGPAPDDLTWTLMNGIDIFLGGDGFKGIDNRLKPFVDNNKPTSKFRPSEKIEVLTGAGNFQLQVAAQRKDSWWRKLLTVAGEALNSPLFAT